MAAEPPTAFDWTGSRGEKWSAQLAGMEAMLAPIDEPLIDALHLDVPVRIADIGCGGGGTTLEIARRAPRGSVVHGFDAAPGLIDVARARTPSDERAIMFTTADVATTPPPEQHYERLVSRFGVMFFKEASTAFYNLARWLAPGGRFAFAVWGRPADNLWFTRVRDVVAELVDVPPPIPGAPGPFRYGQVDDLLMLLRQTGFDQVGMTEWRGMLAIGGGLAAAAAADFALEAFSIAEPLAHADEQVRGKARRALTERFSKHMHNEIVRLDASVHLVTGIRAHAS